MSYQARKRYGGNLNAYANLQRLYTVWFQLYDILEKHNYVDNRRIKINAGEVEKREPLCTAGGNLSWCSHYGKQYEGSSKN